MKHFLKTLLILFICIFSLKAYSNDKFKEGYIISLNGDTTKGFIQEHISRIACEKCVFKLSSESEPKVYLPGEISGYRYLLGKYYVSREVKIDSITKKTVFLEYLINGIASIYYFVDNQEHYYIEKNPDGLVELTEEQRIIYNETEGRNYIAKTKTKGKLLYMLQDCPNINKEIQSTRLTHKSLIKLAKNYHKVVCNSESCIVYEKKDIKEKLKFGLLAGYSNNQYNFGNQAISNYGNNFHIGGTLKLSNFLMFNKHVNLNFGVLFEKDSKSFTLSLFDVDEQYYINYNNTLYVLNGVDFGVNSAIPVVTSMKGDLDVIDLKMPISLNYDFNLSKKTILTCGAGISNKIILTQNKDFRVVDFYAFYGKSINSLLTGLITTVGIEGNWFGKHNFFVNANYEHLIGSKLAVDNSLKLKNKQFSFQLGMYF